MSDPLEEQAMQGRRILVITCDESGDLQMEENNFHAWMLSGIAHWLDGYAEHELENELQADTEDD